MRQIKRSKVKNLQYNKLRLDKYLKSTEISFRQKKLIFKMRTRMIDTPENIGQHVLCKLCYIEQDTQSHITECIVLKVKCPELLQLEKNFAEILSRGRMKDLKVYVTIYEKALRIRQKLLKS